MKQSGLFVLLLALVACTARVGTGETTPLTIEPTPTVRVVMQATDPATLVLGSGQPQLVEFFAFW